MSRRSGQTPKLEIKNGMYTFRYRKDIAGLEERKQVREVIGPVKSMTKSAAEMHIKEYMVKSGINTVDAKIPSVLTFRHAVKNYREVFAPDALMASTLSVANVHLKTHLEPDWNDTPIAHIDIERVNDWARKKRREEKLSWTTIKNILRTMQRVLSCSSKTNEPPFSLKGLVIPQKDKMAMALEAEDAASYSWEDTQKIVQEVRKLDLDDARKQRYATLFLLAAASGLRCSELFALRMDDLDFRENSIRVDESLDRLRNVGPPKNVKAKRPVRLLDIEGKKAMRALKAYVKDRLQNPRAFVFVSRQGTPLAACQVLREALHPALKVAGLVKSGMHGFRRGTNLRWQLAGLQPVVLQKQMGHSSAAMSAHYSKTKNISLAQVQAAFSRQNGPQLVVL